MQQKTRCIKNFCSLLLNSCGFPTFFIEFGSLLNSFMPTFPQFFLYRVVLQYCVWRSDFCRVSWSYISSFSLICSQVNLALYTISLMYKQGRGSIFKSLKIFLQETCLPTLRNILIAFFCRRKIFFYFWGHLPTELLHISDGCGTHAKYIILKTCALVTFVNDFIIQRLVFSFELR